MSKILFSYLFRKNLSAFRAAILANDINRISRILNTKHDYIHKELDIEGNTPLLLAMKYASPSTVRLLLEQGASPDQPNFLTFQTPLGLLAATVYSEEQTHEAHVAFEIANILLDLGAYIDKPSLYQYRDEDGNDYVITETPLMTAVRTRNLPMAMLFVDRKANVNFVEKIFENRPVHFSITNGDVEMFDLLENAGASCRSVLNKENNTLLHCFCHNYNNDENILLLEKLIDKGCDVNAENSARRTPLMLAAKLDMINTCRVLLNAHADIYKIDYKGFQAIDLAKKDSECFYLLKQCKHIASEILKPRQKTDEKNPVKQRTAKYPITKQISEAIIHFSLHDNKIKPFISNINYDDKSLDRQNHSLSIDSHTKCNIEEIHSAYKTKREKLEIKQDLQRTTDLSLLANDSSRFQNRDLFQSKANDLQLKECTINIEL